MLTKAENKKLCSLNQHKNAISIWHLTCRALKTDNWKMEVAFVKMSVSDVAKVCHVLH